MSAALAVAAVTELAARLAKAQELLELVVAGHTQTSRDDTALIQIPAHIFAEIVAATNAAN